MTARLHSLRHQDKKTPVSGQRQSNQQQQSQQQATSQGPSPTPSPSPSPSPSPKHSDGRRANKPLMEKRRRARINQSLAALKALILDSARLENTKHSKLEKADILELTVRHLQRQRSLTQPGLSRYKAGYQDCSREVSRYLDAPDIITGNTSPMDPAVKQRLLRHLDSCVSELDLDLGSRPDSGLGSSPGSVNDRVTGAASPSPLEHHATPTPHCSNAPNVTMIKTEIPEAETARPDSSTTAGDENNNGSRPNSAFSQVNPGIHDPNSATAMSLEQASTSGQNPNMLSVVQVIPSRLPDGQVVFLLPSHYVQLAAAAAANGISIGPNPPTAIWAATNMSLLKATDKLAKRPHEPEIGQDWSQDGAKSLKSPRIEQPEQPLDFTTSKKLRVTRCPTDESPIVPGSQQNVEAPHFQQIQQHQHQQPQQPQQQQQPQPQRIEMITGQTEISMIQEDEDDDDDDDDEARPSSQAGSEIVRISSPSPMCQRQQPVKDDEGMWRPW